MTCIAAVKKGGKVVIGGDSLLTTGSDKKSGVRKITKFPGCYVGFAGMYAIRHSLDNLARDLDYCYDFKMECEEDARLFAKRVFAELREDLGDEDLKEDVEETALLICTSTKIFEVDSMTTCVEHEYYTSIGSGARPAKAVLEVLSKHYPLTPLRDCCIIALETASELDLMCSGPYFVYEVEDEQRPPKPPAKTPQPKTPRPPNTRTIKRNRNLSRGPKGNLPPGDSGKGKSKSKIPKRSAK